MRSLRLAKHAIAAPELRSAPPHAAIQPSKRLLAHSGAAPDVAARASNLNTASACPATASRIAPPKGRLPSPAHGHRAATDPPASADRRRSSAAIREALLQLSDRVPPSDVAQDESDETHASWLDRDRDGDGSSGGDTDGGPTGSGSDDETLKDIDVDLFRAPAPAEAMRAALGAGADVDGERVVLRVPELVRAEVLARPSKQVKSPYLADVSVCGGGEDGGGGEPVMAHTAALGACYVGAQVLMTPRARSSGGVSKYVVNQLVETISGCEVGVGVNPMMAEDAVACAAERGWIRGVPEGSRVERQVMVNHSRLDLACETPGGTVYVEVKNVTLADHADCSTRVRAQLERDGAFADLDPWSKAGIFPGNADPLRSRRVTRTPVSSRALRHVQELAELVQEACGGGGVRAMLVLVAQRPDVDRIALSRLDPTFRRAVRAAADAGVEVRGYRMRWVGTVAIWEGELPVLLGCDADDDATEGLRDNASAI
ncbi:unnamed protein product [Pedinophyceae sp. YPF-701]|nr:unnamed protein product [Pedinophyceae sp. YPF-701]